MVVLNNEILKQIDELGRADQTSMIGDLVINYIGSKNPHENITLALRSIKEDLKEILSHYPDEFIAGQIHYNLIHEVLYELGWVTYSYYYDSVSLNKNYKIKVVVPGKDFGYYIYYSGIKPMVTFYKFNIENEGESNNC